MIDATSLPVVDLAERIAVKAEKRIAEAGQARAVNDLLAFPS